MQGLPAFGRRSRWWPVACAVALVTAACEEPEPEPEPQSAPDGFTYADEIPCESPVEGIDRLSEEGVERGLTRTLSDPGVLGEGGRYGRGGSVIARDLDADGDVDLLFGRLTEPPDIYRNDGSGRFELVESTIEALEGPPTTLAAAVDIDGDRLPELVIGGGEGFYLFPNLGGLRFAPPRVLVPPTELDHLAFLTIAFGDVDGDGDLDAAAPSIGTSVAPGDDTGEPEPAEDLILEQDAGVFSIARSLTLDGEGSTVQVGVFTDRDADGDVDLFLPSDAGPPSRFWRNDDGALIEDGARIGADLAMAAMGIDAADIDGDGLLDYCMSDTGPPRCILTGAGAYVEVGTARGLLPDAPVGSLQTVGWGLDLADLDGDGHLEVLQASGPFPDAEGEIEEALPNLLWHGRPDGSWEDVSAEVGFDSVDNDLGLATADVDGDGWLDVVVAGPLDVPSLFMNRCGAGGWLQFELRGPAGNSEGHHARVEVWTGDTRRIREVHNVRGQSEGPATLHFGLGAVDVADRVVVRWADGTVSEAEGVPARRRVVVEHPDAVEAGDDDDVAEFVTVSGSTFNLFDGQTIPGVRVSSLEVPGIVGATDGGGRYTLSLPLGTASHLRAEQDGFVDTVTAIDPSTQQEPEAGVVNPLIPDAGIEELYADLHGTPRDPAATSLWVEVIDTRTGRGLTGATVSIDREHGGVVLLGGGEPELTATLSEEASIVAFANVAPGPVGVSVATPAGESCVGLGRLEAIGGAVTYTQLQCAP